MEERVNLLVFFVAQGAQIPHPKSKIPPPDGTPICCTDFYTKFSFYINSPRTSLYPLTEASLYALAEKVREEIKNVIDGFADFLIWPMEHYDDDDEWMHEDYDPFNEPEIYEDGVKEHEKLGEYKKLEILLVRKIFQFLQLDAFNDNDGLVWIQEEDEKSGACALFITDPEICRLLTVLKFLVCIDTRWANIHYEEEDEEDEIIEESQERDPLIKKGFRAFKKFLAQPSPK